MSPEEFEQIKNKIRYDFIKDNYFEELKEAEILRERMNTLREMEETVGVYYSRQWVIRNVLQMSEEDFEEIRDQIEAEKEMFPDEDEDL